MMDGKKRIRILTCAKCGVASKKMLVPHIKLCSDSYRNHVFTGFSRLQAQEEFVDLTLAADGHLVYVHKNIIALASPYLKEMMQLAPSQNAVIFLNNVSYEILCYLLEYIYQGEVSVPEDQIQSFVQISKALHIVSINEDCVTQINNKSNQNSASQIQVPPHEEINANQESFAAHIKIHSDHNLEVQYVDTSHNQVNTNTITPIIIDSGVLLNTIPGFDPNKNVRNDPVIDSFTNAERPTYIPEDPSTMEYETSANENSLLSEIKIIKNKLIPKTTKPHKTKPQEPKTQETIILDKESAKALKMITQYSVSERGCAQIIVNRYIYYSHHESKRGRKIRWRCIDYRKHKCQASVDSLDGTITARKGIHKHPFHDEKIHKKFNKKLIFASKTQAQNNYNKTERSSDPIDLECEIEASFVPKE